MIGIAETGYAVPDGWAVMGRGHGSYALVRKVDGDTWTITATDGPFVPDTSTEEVLLSHYAGEGWQNWDGIAEADWTMGNVGLAVIAVHEVYIGVRFCGAHHDILSSETR